MCWALMGGPAEGRARWWVPQPSRTAATKCEGCCLLCTTQTWPRLPHSASRTGTRLSSTHPGERLQGQPTWSTACAHALAQGPRALSSSFTCFSPNEWALFRSPFTDKHAVVREVQSPRAYTAGKAPAGT